MMEAVDPVKPIHRISVGQFHRMIEAGVLAEGALSATIEGVDIEVDAAGLMGGQGPG